jgi:hypothetical protein
MGDTIYLALSDALSKLESTKYELAATTGLPLDEINRMEREGVDLGQAEIIAQSYAHHPSEIWGDKWVDAVLTLVDWREDDDYNQ